MTQTPDLGELTGTALAAYIQHTKIAVGTTREQMLTHLQEAVDYGFDAAMVAGSWVPLAAEVLAGTGITVASALDFPTVGVMTSAGKAAEAALLLKALAHDGRLMILCHLARGERTVTELENLLDSRQAAVSQQLARLRADGIVTCRRAGKSRVYSIADPRAAELIAVLCAMF